MSQKQQRRTLRSLSLTSKYFIPYFGNIVFLMLGILVLLFVMIAFFVTNTVGSSDPEAYRLVMLSVALGTLLTAATIIFVCALTAHRIAGVHIKLKSTFDRIAAGDLDSRLYFRKEDNLDDVAGSFNIMMESLLRPKPPQERPAETL